MTPTYEEMLDEAYKKLSSMKVLHGSTLGSINIPLPKINYVGKWTSIENAGTICDIINRDINLLAEFLQKEFSVASKIEDKKIILQKRIEFDKIKAKIDKFIDIFVMCPICKKLDTRLEKRERVYIIKCLACGAESPVIYKLK
jgi:translation initiation factor 2 subunit 2